MLSFTMGSPVNFIPSNNSDEILRLEVVEAEPKRFGYDNSMDVRNSFKDDGITMALGELPDVVATYRLLGYRVT